MLLSKEHRKRTQNNINLKKSTRFPRRIKQRSLNSVTHLASGVGVGVNLY